MDQNAHLPADAPAVDNPAARLAAHVAGLALAAVGMAAAAGVVAVDAILLQNGVAEASLTEFLQECLLALATFAALRRTVRDPAHRGLAVLMAGLFGAMLFREMDGAFDRLVGHGMWRLFVWPWLAVMSGLALRHRATIIPAASEFVRTRTYVLVATGLLIVLVYSRIIGVKSVWNALQEEPPLRTVKNAVEECVELLGYGLLACGTWVYGRARQNAATAA